VRVNGSGKRGKCDRWHRYRRIKEEWEGELISLTIGLRRLWFLQKVVTIRLAPEPVCKGRQFVKEKNTRDLLPETTSPRTII